MHTARQLFIVWFLTWSVLAIELALGSLIWFRRSRYWILGCGIIFHLSINLFMQFPVFQSVMIVSLLNFVEPQEIDNLISRYRTFLACAPSKSAKFMRRLAPDSD